MAHRIEWLLPNHILLATVSGPTSAEDVLFVSGKIIEYMDTAKDAQRFHLLVDVRECVLSDKAWNYSKIPLHRHPSTGWVIVIGDSRLGGLAIAIFSKILKMHLQYSATMESALDILAQRDPIVAEFRQQSDATPPPTSSE